MKAEVVRDEAWCERQTKGWIAYVSYMEDIGMYGSSGEAQELLAEMKAENEEEE